MTELARVQLQKCLSWTVLLTQASTVEEQACAERHFKMTALLPGPTLARFGLKSGIWLQKRDTSEPMILIATV